MVTFDVVCVLFAYVILKLVFFWDVIKVKVPSLLFVASFHVLSRYCSVPPVNNEPLLLRSLTAQFKNRGRILNCILSDASYFVRSLMKIVPDLVISFERIFA